MIDSKALRKLSYSVYLVTAKPLFSRVLKGANFYTICFKRC